MHVAPADQHDVMTRDDSCCWCVQGVVICTNGTQTLQQSADPDMRYTCDKRGIDTGRSMHTTELFKLVRNELIINAANCRMQLHQAYLLTFSMIDG